MKIKKKRNETNKKWSIQIDNPAQLDLIGQYSEKLFTGDNFPKDNFFATNSLVST